MIKEIYATTTKEVSINVVDYEIESVRNKAITKTGVRVYDKGCIGVAGGIGEVNLEQLEQEAIDNIALGIPYQEEISTKLELHQDQGKAEFDEVTFVTQTEKLLGILKERYPRFTISEKINMKQTYTSLKNDVGLDLSHSDLTFEVGLIVREESSINVIDTFIGYEARTFDLEIVLGIAEDVLGNYHNEVGLPDKKRLPVIISKHAIEKKLIQELNGESVAKGSSLFKDMIGESKFSENFTYGEYVGEETYHTPFFDAEGVVNENFRCNLIENGTIISPYTDKKVARKYNCPLTGSSIGAYDGVPTLGARSTKIQTTNQTLEEMLDGELGVIVIMASGGDYTPEGNFGSPVQCAMLTDGKKVLGRLPLINISGNLFDMFGKDYKGFTSDKVFFDEQYAVIEMNVSLA